MRTALVLFVFIVACYGQDFDVRQHLGTKSPYPVPVNPIRTPVPQGCSAIHLDLLARHGSREPTTNDIKALIKLAADLQAYGQFITNETFAWMKNWTSPFELINQGLLSYSGELEHYRLGQRAKTEYYPLLSQEYFPNVYPIQSTQISRTGVSASSYAYGFLEGEGQLGNNTNYEPIFSLTESLNQDTTLRFFSVCQQYLDATANNTINTFESEKYSNMVYPKIAVDIADRLGVTGNWNISSNDVDTLFTACAFQASLDNNIDGFCELFSQSEIEEYEYIDDLDDYYTSGYGSGLGYQISAPLLQNIVQTMDKAITANPLYEKAYLRFAHAETLMPLVALLNLYQDSEPITADSTSDQIANRKWRGSNISPFAANLMFVLYQCDDGSNKVKILHNENEVQISGCDSVYCDYTQFKAAQPIYNGLHYNFTDACAIPTPTPKPTPTPTPHADDEVVMKKWELAITIVFSVAFAMILTTTANTFYFKHKFKKGYQPLGL